MLFEVDVPPFGYSTYRIKQVKTGKRTVSGNEKTMKERLAGEIMDAINGTGGACKQQERAERYTENAFHNQALCFTMLRTVMFEIT